MKCVIIVNTRLIIFSDIGGMLVHSVLKSNQIAQQVISDGAKAKQNGGNLLMTLNLNYKNKTNTVITNIRIAFLSIFVLKSNNKKWFTHKELPCAIRRYVIDPLSVRYLIKSPFVDYPLPCTGNIIAQRLT